MPSLWHHLLGLPAHRQKFGIYVTLILELDLHFGGFEDTTSSLPPIQQHTFSNLIRTPTGGASTKSCTVAPLLLARILSATCADHQLTLPPPVPSPLKKTTNNDKLPYLGHLLNDFLIIWPPSSPPTQGFTTLSSVFYEHDKLLRRNPRALQHHWSSSALHTRPSCL